jgi:GDP-L-fucose synthase
LYENLQIQNNLIWNAHEVGVKKFLFLGSSCIYPRDAKQPIREDYFMDGQLEKTNEGYAVAKIAGMKLCEFINSQLGEKFISAMPTNLYGENDNFDPETSHVLPGLMGRMHKAKLAGDPEFVVWGTGTPRREFLHVDDLADALVWLLENYEDKQFLNIGTGEDITIRELAETLQRVIGYEGKLVFDASKPDGTPRKLLDVSRLRATGWKHKIGFEEGVKRTYQWFLDNAARAH